MLTDFRLQFSIDIYIIVFVFMPIFFVNYIQYT